MSPSMGNNLRRLRIDRGWTHDQAGAAMGISRSSFIKLERGDRRLNEKTISQAAKAFEVDASTVIEEPQGVEIVGLVGADPSGGMIYASSHGQLGWAPMPPSASDKTVAVEVRGESMRGVAEDGWIIYYENERGPILEDMIGELCIIWLTDGQVVIKKPYHGHEAGRFNLESTSASTMREQEVECAALVDWIAPQRTAKKVVRRG